MKQIATAAGLRAAAIEHLNADSLLHWRIKKYERGGLDLGSDMIVQLEAGGKRRTFEVECKLLPTARALDAIAKRRHRFPVLLIAPKLSNNLIRLCHERKLNALDLNGRTFINVQGLVVDRSGLEVSRIRPALPQLNPFATKASRIPRALLSNPGAAWTVTSLVDRTSLTAGLVSRVLKTLEGEGWIERKGRQIQLVRSKELLDAWAAEDDFSKRTTVFEYSALTGDLDELAEKARGCTPGSPVAFSQWYAAARRFPYTTPPLVSAYVFHPPTSEIEAKLGLRRVATGGRLHLLVPSDEGVFQEGRSLRQYFLVSDTQIYLDLVNAPLRGPDQAAALRDWEGFNRGR